jgi:preprotein translocase subunit SecD
MSAGFETGLVRQEFSERERTMSRKLVLIAAALLLSCAAVFAVLVFVVGLGNPVLWAQRQLTILSVRGGPEVVLEVDAEAVLRRVYELLRRDTVGLLRGARLSFNTRLTDAGLEITARPEDRETVMREVRSLFGSPDMADIKPADDGVRVSFTDTGLAAGTRKAAELSRDLITNRLTDLGMRVVVTVQPPQAGARLVVQMARTDDPKRLIEFATKRGELGFRLIDVTMTPEKAMASAPPPDSELLYGRKESDRSPYLVEKRAIMSGSDLIDAQPGFDARTNEPIVSFRFSTAGARKFAQATSENVGRPFAIVVDGEVLSAPIIREPITGGSGQISGAFTVQSANDLATVLRHGELPARLKVIEERAAKGG